MIERAKQQVASEQLEFSIDQLCRWYGISRQAHYQQLRRQVAQSADAAQVVMRVKRIRERHPRMGRTQTAA